MKLASLFVTGTLACDRCIDCPDGVQYVNPIGVKLLCQDEQAYVQVDTKTNFAKIDARRLNGSTSAWLCTANHWTQEMSYANAGSTTFSGYRVQFDNDGNAFLRRSDMLLGESEPITLDDGTVLQNEIWAGTAGDCYAWANCDDTKMGSFSIDLTGTGLAFAESVEWKASGWPEYMQMADYVRTDQTASARCGGWCGSCAPDLDDEKLIPLVKWGGAPPPVETRVNKLLEKFAEVLELGGVKEHVQEKANALMSKMANQMIEKHENFRDVKGCNYPDTWKANADEDDQVRFDREDPCKGLKQIFTGFRKWGEIFNRNCKNPDKWFAYHDRREKTAINLRNRLLGKMKCN